MAANGIDWEGKTSKPIEELSTDEKLIVLIGVITDQTRQQAELKKQIADFQEAVEKKINCIPALKGMQKAMSWLIPIIISLIVLISAILANHIAASVTKAAGG